MIKIINFNDFLDEWNIFEDRKNTFSYEGKKALFEYLQEYEESTGEGVKLDIIALCCEYSEHESAIKCAENYFAFGLSDIDNITSDEAEEEALVFLQDNTQVIEVEDGGIIIQDF